MFFLLRKNYELAFISHIDSENNKAVISFAQIVSFMRLTVRLGWKKGWRVGRREGGEGVGA